MASSTIQCMLKIVLKSLHSGGKYFASGTQVTGSISAGNCVLHIEAELVAQCLLPVYELVVSHSVTDVIRYSSMRLLINRPLIHLPDGNLYDSLVTVTSYICLIDRSAT